MPSNIKKRAEMVRLLTCDLCDRINEREKVCGKHGFRWTGYDYPKGKGIAKTQIHADIVQLRRMLALLDKEVSDDD